MPKIRKARPEDIKEIADIFKTVYTDKHGYTREEEVRKDLENRAITSFVAVEGNMVVGHGQLRPPEYDFVAEETNGVEIARVGVHRTHQNKGIGKQIIKALYDIAVLKDPNFVFTDFNTSTDYSQRAMKHIGFVPVALLLGYAPDFTNIGQSNSFLVGMKINREQDQAAVYVPDEHRKLAQLVYGNLGLKRKIKKKTDNDQTLLEFEVELMMYVADSKEMLERDGYNPHLITIDLSQPSALEKVQIAKEAGLVVEGLVPLVKEDGTRHDKLVMSYMPDLDLGKVKVYPSLNRKFAEMIFDSMER